MKRIIITGAALLAIVPASLGLISNASFAQSIPVSVPSPASVLDDKGGLTNHVEPGDDKGGLSTHIESGDDNDGLSSSDDGPGDDNGGLLNDVETGDDASGHNGSDDSTSDDNGSHSGSDDGPSHS